MEFHGWEIELEGNGDIYQSNTERKLVLIGRRFDSTLVLGNLEVDEENLLHIHNPQNLVVTFVKEKHVKIKMMSTSYFEREGEQEV